MTCNSLRLARAYAAAAGCRLSVVSSRIAGSGDAFTRLERGSSITIRREQALVQRFSDHWLSGVAWPLGIPRPEPTPGSPAAASSSTTQSCARSSADPAAAAKALIARRWELARGDAASNVELQELLAQAVEIAGRLDPATGRIASPAAVCMVVGCSRQVYDDAVRRYTGPQGIARRPRGQSNTAQVVAFLRKAGDVRFIGQSTPPPPAIGGAAETIRETLAGA